MANLRKKKVAVYCRVANKDQLGLECQHERMRAFVAEHPGWELVKTFSDTCPASPLESRDGLERLLLGARNREFTLVVLPSRSRLSRQMHHFQMLATTLAQAGVELHFADGNSTDEIKELFSYIQNWEV